MKLILGLLVTLFIGTFANLGCSPALKNTDCAHGLVCAKILLGTTASTRARGKYFYKCLPQQLIAKAIKAVQSQQGTLSVKVNGQDHHIALEKHLLNIVQQEPVKEEKVYESKIHNEIPVTETEKQSIKHSLDQTKNEEKIQQALKEENDNQENENVEDEDEDNVDEEDDQEDGF
eukprot:gene1264-11351_t